jgi:urocanate hydratase
VDGTHPIRAGRGTKLRAQSWRTEGLARLLENVLEIGERPDELIVYAALAKAARDWPSYRLIHKTLLDLGDNETLVIQSGRPVGVFPTHVDAPRVLVANSNLVGRWATPEQFYRLSAKNLIMWGGLTAGCWQYIGFQGVLQGTFETFSAVARAHFGRDDLAGTWVVSAGLGGTGSAQGLAISMLDGVSLIAEVDGDRARARAASGLCDRATGSLDDAVSWCREAREARRPLSVAWIGHAVEMLEALLARGVTPDIATDMTSAHDALHGYRPLGMSLPDADALRQADPGLLSRRARDSMVRHIKALLALRDRGCVVFDYGNNLRSQAAEAGYPDAFRIHVFAELYLRDLFCRGIGPFRWIALSGEPADIAWIDDLVLRLFSDNARVQRWIRKAQARVPFQGLPARTAWLGHQERGRVGEEVNRAVAAGTLAAPVAFTRDHLDAGSMAHPNIMTENLRDGSDAVADWPLLNALLNTASGADLVAIHSGGGGYAGYMTSAGMTVIADGTAGAGRRIGRVTNADTGLGVLRYADAGYPAAVEAARAGGLRALNLEAGGGGQADTDPH